MSIKQEYEQLKSLITQGGELFFLRLRLLGLDAREQLSTMIYIVAALFAMAVLAFISLLALLLGLNVVLTEQAKIWVFFGLAGVGLLLILGLCIWIPYKWKRSNQHISETLNAMQGDWQALCGKLPPSSLGEHHE